MIKVYVAGKYNDSNVMNVLDNINNGNRKAVEVLLEGYAPFSPWLDFLFHFSTREDKGEKLTIDHYYNYSIAWLKVSDVMYVHENSNWKTSKGTLKEIEVAKELNIPIVYSLKELREKFPVE